MGRGEQRLCSITYSQIAAWTGLALDTVRTYAQKGQFQRDSLESVLAWVNARRAAKGLPLIGMPDVQPRETRLPPPAPAGYDSGGYDPLTGEFT